MEYLKLAVGTILFITISLMLIKNSVLRVYFLDLKSRFRKVN